MQDNHEDDFVKNYEEQDSSDEFEAQVNETISAHVKQNQNRPPSKTVRPESSRYNAQNWKGPSNGSKTELNNQKEQQQEKFNKNEYDKTYSHNDQKQTNNQSDDYSQQQKTKQVYQALKKQSSQQPPNPIIQKMSKFIAFHHISLETFWKSSRIYVELEEFIEYCLEIGMLIQQWEVEKYQSELTDENGYVTIKILCDKIQPWNSQENAMLEFIKERVLSMAQSSKKKFRVQSQKVARQASARSGQQRPYSGATQEMQNSQYTIFENKSKIYLQKHKQKSKDQDKILNITINKNQNEHEYECLIKMGEANEIQEQLNSNKNYRAYKNPNNIKSKQSSIYLFENKQEGHMMVHAYDGERFLIEMTLSEFKREHTSLKLQYNESKNLKIWDVLSENKKAIKGRDFSKNIEKGDSVVVEQVDGEATGKKVKVTRQQQLKKVLLETMWLSNIINEQSNILQKKGINVNNMLNKSFHATQNVNRSMNASHQI